MNNGRVTFYRWNDMPLEPVNDLLHRRFVTGDQSMLAQIHLKKDCLVPAHAQENEQITYVLQGALHFWIGDDQKQELTVAAGEVLHIRSNVRHKALALEDTLVADVFTPPRQDWIDKTDAYLRR